MIVDDNYRIRELMRECLQQLGFTDITEAKNGWDALKLSEQCLPDIVTLDWNMPKMDGLEYLTELRLLPDGNKPVVVFCSTENSKSKIDMVLAAGANEYITKPFNVKIVRQKFSALGLI